MEAARSRIHNELDLDAAGRHFGHLRIPHSVHRSAYGWLPMPIASLKNGAGPRVLMMGGNHGDEYEGQVVLSRLARELDLVRLRGQLIIVPMANYPAARAGTRTSPIDAGNLNRSFPGDPDGGITQMIAHFIELVLLPGCDLLLDLHAGGSSLLYTPSVQAGLDPQGRLDARMRKLVDAFAAPVSQLYRPGVENRMAESAADRQGVRWLLAELGGAGMLTRETVAVTTHGVERLLAALGALTRAEAPPAPATRYVEIRAEHFCQAPEDGVFEPLVELGDEVRAGQTAALIHFPESPAREPVPVAFEAPGLVICRRVPAQCQRGDCLFHLGADYDPD